MIDIISVNQWNDVLKGTDDVPIVLKFGAEWCKPCKIIEPHFKLLSEEENYKNALFLKIDIDTMPQLAEKFDIASVPTFIVLHRGEIVKKTSGASMSTLAEIRAALNGLQV